MSRKTVRSATMVVAAAALALALGGGTARAASTLAPAPDFTLTLLDGKTLGPADLKGKPVLVNFWQAG